MRLTAALFAGLWIVSASTDPGAQQSAPRPGLDTQPAITISEDEGVVRGRVTDARSGQPVVRATVIMAPTFVGATSQSEETGPDGRYEIRDLSPGVHRVFVEADGYVPYGGEGSEAKAAVIDVVGGRVTPGVDAQLARSAAISGRIFDAGGQGFPGVEVEVLVNRYLPGGQRLVPIAFGRTDGLGLFRISDLAPGEYYVRAYTPRTQSHVPGEPNASYSVTFYPTTPESDGALPLRVGSGQELAGIDFALSTLESVEVAGTVVSASGQPIDSVVTMFRFDAPPQREGTGRVATASGPETGSFRFTNVLAGQYALRVIKAGVGMAYRQITVESDISDLALVLQPGIEVQGRVFVEGAGTLPVSPAGPFQVKAATRTDRGGMLVTPGTATVDPDGSFVLDEVLSEATLSVSRLPIGWTVQAVRQGGIDITDIPTDFSTSVGQPIEIVITNRIAEVVGEVVDHRGQSLSTYTVVIFAEDPRRWVPYSRYVQGSDAIHGGSFRFTDLPPAAYLAVAVPELPPNAWTDTDVLRLLRLRATRFELGKGEHRTLRLELSPTPSGLAP